MFTKIFIFVLIFILSQEQSHGALHGSTKKMVDQANKNGPYLGLVIPNMFEMNPLLDNPHYKSSKLVIDYAGILVLQNHLLFDKLKTFFNELILIGLKEGGFGLERFTRNQ